MYRFFVEESQIYDGTVHITGSDVNHIKNVLRMRPGEKILVSTGGEKEYHCAVSDFPEGEVLAAVEEVTAADRELPSGIVLFQGLPKGDKMELIIQKAVELGATEIVPVEMKRCVVKLDRKKAEKKAERWQTIALGAAKQSKRMQIPTVHMPVTFQQALAMMAESDVRLMPYENAEGMEGTRKILESIEPGESIVEAVIREMKEETGLTIKNPRLCGVKQFPIDGGRYIVFLFETDQFEGELADSEEGKMHWIKDSDLSNVNLVNDFEELIEVMLNDSLTEFQYVIENDEWIIVKK